MELRKNDGVPTECTHHFSVDFIWKSTSFDRYLSYQFFTTCERGANFQQNLFGVLNGIFCLHRLILMVCVFKKALV